MKASGSRTRKASPLGSQHTMLKSSLLSISINFLGNGLEWPVDEPEPGLETADNAGETDPRLPRLVCDLNDKARCIVVVLLFAANPQPLGLVPSSAVLRGLPAIPVCNLITPAAIPPPPGTKTAGGGGIGATTG